MQLITMHTCNCTWSCEISALSAINKTCHKYSVTVLAVQLQNINLKHINSSVKMVLKNWNRLKNFLIQFSEIWIKTRNYNKTAKKRLFTDWQRTALCHLASLFCAVCRPSILSADQWIYNCTEGSLVLHVHFNHIYSDSSAAILFTTASQKSEIMS